MPDYGPKTSNPGNVAQLTRGQLHFLGLSGEFL